MRTHSSSFSSPFDLSSISIRTERKHSNGHCHFIFDFRARFEFNTKINSMVNSKRSVSIYSKCRRLFMQLPLSTKWKHTLASIQRLTLKYASQILSMVNSFRSIVCARAFFPFIFRNYIHSRYFIVATTDAAVAIAAAITSCVIRSHHQSETNRGW